MSLEEFGLRRRVHSSTPSMNALYTPWPKCVSRYESKEISQRREYEYSKIRAIHTLYESIKLRPQEEQNAPLLRALLTDCGLLFPQTRERGYDAFHSMRLSALAVPHYHAEAAQIECPAYAECRDRFYITHSKDIPFIAEEKVSACLESLRAKFDPPWDLIEPSGEFELGYVIPEITKLDYAKAPAEAEHWMSAWTDHVRFTWGWGEDFLDAKTLKETLELSAAELYEFLAFVLRQHLLKRRQRDEWSAVAYQPALNNSQLDAFAKQISRFQSEDLSRWKNALPVLGEYLHPNLEPFANLTYSVSESEETLSGSCAKLALAFQGYLKRMEPSEKSITDFCLKAAEWFLTFSPNKKVGDKPFLASPHLIFHLFRAPVYRHVVNFENRNWKLKRVIEDAYLRNPLPITPQFLDADAKLFHTIVDVCAKECRKSGCDFQEDAWNALWDCISQCVHCLQFQIGDLFSVRDDFLHTLYLRDLGAPVLDAWIEQKLTSDAPNYISIWRALVKKWCSPSRKRSTELATAVEIFQSRFVDPTIYGSCITYLLDVLCDEINWTGISFLPPGQELADINPNIKPRARNKEADTIRDGIRAVRMKVPAEDEAKEAKQRQRAEREKVHLSFKRVWMEWLLLQCVCDQTRRELMESVYLYLSKT